jgi:5,10-methylenetetrahydromethanopterin reductase
MDIGIFTQTDDVDDLVEQAREIAAQGFETMWIPQIFGIDAITALAVVAREVPDLRFGTAVIPTYPRHPAMLAAQAKTLSHISGGRFTLGIGLSHQIVIEGMFGMSYDKPVRHMREHLDVLLPLLANEPISSEGDTLTFRGGLSFNSPPTPVLVAALGPAMLKLAGRRTDGTSTWMTGPTTIRDHVAPTIRAAAEEAGRAEPQILTSVPVCVTDKPGPALERAASQFEMYGGLPSYRAMMDREGVDGPAGIAIVGNADEVAERIGGFFSAGTTLFGGVTFGNPDEQAATRGVLSELNQRG